MAPDDSSPRKPGVWGGGRTIVPAGPKEERHEGPHGKDVSMDLHSEDLQITVWVTLHMLGPLSRLHSHLVFAVDWVPVSFGLVRLYR